MEEYAVESTVFDLPHVLHFDIQITTENTSNDEATATQIIGRRIQLADDQYRNDVVLITSHSAGIEFKKECNIKLSREERWVATYGDEGDPSDVNVIKIDNPDHPQSYVLFHCHPYYIPIFGVSSIIRNSQSRDRVMEFVIRTTPFVDPNRYMKSKAHPIVDEYTFDSDDTWKLTKFRSHVPQGDFSEVIRNFKEPVTTLEDIKGWRVFCESQIKWRQLEEKSHVPFWMVRKEAGYVANDPGRIREMEAFFFGINLDTEEYKKLVDPKRLNIESLEADFNLEKIEAMANRERKQFLTK
jgi:hypothetical protein